MIIETLLPIACDRLVTISEKARLTEAADRLGNGQTSLIVVCDDSGIMVGVVSKTDIVSRISQCQGGACMTLLGSVMSREIVCCHPNDSLQGVWSLMKESGFLHIPIVDQVSRPLGILYAHDALHALLGEVEYEEALLRDYVMGIGYR